MRFERNRSRPCVGRNHKTPGRAPRISSTRILAYHGVHPAHGDGLTINSTLFHEQMKWLAMQRIRVVTLTALCIEAARAGRWPVKTLALTFDDGYRDCSEYVQPVLREFGFTATVFVITDSLVAGRQRPLYCPSHKEFLSKTELWQLAQEGWEIGSHTCDHSRLPTLAEDEQGRQLMESKRVLEGELEREITTFCYPAGRLTATSVKLARMTGYHRAPVTPWRRGLVETGNWLTLERTGLYRNDYLPRFRFKLNPLFHWLREARFLVTPSRIRD